MAIKVLKKVKHNGKYYEKNEVIKKIKKEEEQRLIDLGAAVSLDAKDEDSKKNGAHINSQED